MVFNNENEMILLKQLNETAFMNGNKMKIIFFCAALCGNYVKHEFICTTKTTTKREKIRKFNGDVIYVVH